MHGAASKTGTRSVGAKKLAQHRPSSGSSAKKLAQHARKRQFWAIVSAQGKLFRARAHIRPSRANFFAHEARQRGDVETTNTTARPQQGSLETGITSAPENCTKNAHFSPAKATAVSIEARPAPAKAMAVSVAARPAPAKATPVSDKRAAWLAGGPPPMGTQSSPAPLVWRAPEGPEGTGGLRGAAPNEVRP